ncbi:hypothetical protein B0T12DRAFT_486270 [Alternaria alternata]|nr:hypothetical protein B0T12DRAFT_486270 [Alternaria alternata]
MSKQSSSSITRDLRVEARETNSEIPLSTNDQRKIDIAQRNATSSPLLRLPPEIRNMIYTLILDVNTVMVAHAGLVRSRRFEISVTLLRVCRQIHAEAALLPYAFNTFVFWGTTLSLKTFLDGRNKEQIAAMRKVQWGSDGSATALEWIKVLRKLDRESF